MYSFIHYSGYDWCKMKSRMYEMDIFEDGLKYGVVKEITASKIVIVNYYKISNTDNIVRSVKYINKNMVLNKINYEDNTEQYIKCKKLFGYRYILDINKINNITEYFENVNKKQLIRIQKHFKKRP